MTLLDDPRTETSAADPAREPADALANPMRSARTGLDGSRGWLAALIIAVFSWDPAITRIVLPSIDDSWRYMLQQAVADGLDFGVDTAFTYGPLLHLDGGPMYSFVSGLASVLVALILSWCCALFVIRRCSLMGLGTWPAALSALVVTIVIIPPLRFSETVALLACSWLLAELIDGRSTTLVRYNVAVLAGVWLAVKPSAGIVILGAVIGAAFASGFENESVLSWEKNASRRAIRRAGAVAGIGGATFVSSWLATGQSLGSIDNYLLGAKELADGFAEGMAVAPPHPWLEVGFAALGFVLLALVGRRAITERNPNAVFAFVLLLMVLFWARQIAFARPDRAHLKDAGVALTLIGVAVWPLVGRISGRVAIAVAAVLTTTILVPAHFYQVGTFRSAGPVEFVLAVRELVNSDDVIEAGREPLKDLIVPRETLATELDGKRVMYWPYLGAGAFAAQTEQWFPPALQAYASFTNELEERGAAGLDSVDGPDMIVYRYDYAIDGRRPAWESPRMQVAIFCSFDYVNEDDTFVLLTRVNERCDGPVPIASNVDVIDLEVAIPDDARSCPGVVTFSVTGAEASSTDRLKHLFVRPNPFTVTIDGEWRFNSATGSQPHVIAAPAGETWIGEAVPTPDRLSATIQFNDAFDDRGPLTVDFGCWTPTPIPE